MKRDSRRDVVYGPVTSRRLGRSLGINILPVERKLCNFDCIYCERGWNPRPYHKEEGRTLLTSAKDILHILEERIEELAQEGTLPNVVSFSGNGEPTLHPEFPDIIKGTLAIRDRWMPGVKVCVFSNSGTLDRPGVFEALTMADGRFMKLDSAREETVQLINRPQPGYTVAKAVEQLKKFEGNFTLQTLFFKGTFAGQTVDNTTPEELDAWFFLVEELKPWRVMVYTLDRKTPAEGLIKCPSEKLHEIAARLKAKNIPVLMGE
ncbi:MAG: radical SAM protein [Bacteroidales bacterium]|jgi:wyosine [tRNA(Phe)-imidazoG37] synthetase (radical SAM superfamily)|nr:radical SAM protein [Bacteroidales bacterium]HHV40291.1 radical SAM protein [Bacteroidales bacterium]